MLLMSLWWGQTAFFHSGFVSLATGACAVSLACLGGGLLSGVLEPGAIPDEQMGSVTSRIMLAMLVVGVIAFLLIFLVPRI